MCVPLRSGGSGSGRRPGARAGRSGSSNDQARGSGGVDPGAERPPGVGRRTLGVQVMAGTRRLGSHCPALVLWMEASPEAEEQMGVWQEKGVCLKTWGCPVVDLHVEAPERGRG